MTWECTTLLRKRGHKPFLFFLYFFFYFEQKIWYKWRVRKSFDVFYVIINFAFVSLPSIGLKKNIFFCNLCELAAEDEPIIIRNCKHIEGFLSVWSVISLGRIMNLYVYDFTVGRWSITVIRLQEAKSYQQFSQWSVQTEN